MEGQRSSISRSAPPQETLLHSSSPSAFVTHSRDFGLLEVENRAREDHLEAARWPQRHGRSHGGRRGAGVACEQRAAGADRDKSGHTKPLSVRLAGLKQRRSRSRTCRPRSRVMLADGGDCSLTAERCVIRTPCSARSLRTRRRFGSSMRSRARRGCLMGLADAHARAREHVWTLPERPSRSRSRSTRR
jgi:hypothetical protein